MADKKLNLSTFDVWAMGITVVIGGQYFGWNVGLDAGIGSFAIAVALIAGAYFCLCSCVSELSSCVPFAGGTYGMARCSFGSHIGFIVGCCEAFEYIIYVAVSTVSFGDMVVIMIPSVEHYVPLVWIALFATSLFFHIKGGKLFWNFTAFLAWISFLLVLIYGFGAIKFADFNKYAKFDASSSSSSPVSYNTTNITDSFVHTPTSSHRFVESLSSESAAEARMHRQHNEWFRGGISNFMTAFPLAAWFFVGVESLNMMCEDCTRPKEIIPAGQMRCIVTLMSTALLVLFVATSLPPGIAEVADSLIVFNRGYALMFGMAPNACTIFSLPATYATAFGFIYSYGKLLVAMAESSLLPSLFAMRTGANSTPAFALTVGSCLAFVICLITHYTIDIYPQLNAELFNLCMLCSFTAYISQCIGFVHMRKNFRFESISGNTSQQNQGPTSPPASPAPNANVNNGSPRPGSPSPGPGGPQSPLTPHNQQSQSNAGQSSSSSSSAFLGTYRSVVGFYGAAFSICVWVLGIVSIIGFQNSVLPICAYVCMVMSISAYYFLFAKKEGLSSNENEILFFALFIHLANYKSEDKEMDRVSMHVNQLHDADSMERIRLFNMRRVHPDVLGAAKLNMLREFQKLVPLNCDKEGGELQEAEVQRLRLLYSTPNKNWFTIQKENENVHHKSNTWGIGGNRQLTKAARLEAEKETRFNFYSQINNSTYFAYDEEEKLHMPSNTSFTDFQNFQSRDYDDESFAVNRTGSGSFDFNRQRVQESSSDEAGNYNQYVGVNADGDDGDVGIQLNQM